MQFLRFKKWEDRGFGSSVNRKWRGNHTISGVCLPPRTLGDTGHVAIILEKFRCYLDGFHPQVDGRHGNSLENENQTPG